MPHPFLTAEYADERARTFRAQAAAPRRPSRRPALGRRHVVAPEAPVELPFLTPAAEACRAA
jgi:hypothetical protein